MSVPIALLAPAVAPRAQGIRRLGVVALVVWFTAMLLLGAGLLARHLIALPAPIADDRLGEMLGALRTPREKGHWLAVHVLYSACDCSQRIVAHLASTERPSPYRELVLWVGPGAPNIALENKGFRVLRVTRSQLTMLGIESAPLLIAVDPSDRAQYSGGYTDRKQGPAIDDLPILAAAFSHHATRVLPVFGCAVSERLTRELSALPTP